MNRGTTRKPRWVAGARDLGVLGSFDCVHIIMNNPEERCELDHNSGAQLENKLYFRGMRSRGFNLLEMLIAGFIFSLASIFMVGVWGTHYRSVSKSRHRIVANFIAESTIERAIADGYDALPDSDVQTNVHRVFTTRHGNTSEIEYTITMTIQRFGNLTPPLGGREDKLKKVTVEVTWDEPRLQGYLVLDTVVGSAN